jgi:hypothetical protein
MTEKRQTSQGYIMRILQHFATKLWNITNFVMLFQAVVKFLSRLVEIQILVIGNTRSIRSIPIVGILPTLSETVLKAFIIHEGNSKEMHINYVFRTKRKIRQL